MTFRKSSTEEKIDVSDRPEFTSVQFKMVMVSEPVTKGGVGL